VARGQYRSPTHHNITNLCKIQSTTTISFLNQTQPLHQLYSYRSASDSSSIVTIKLVTPDDIISGLSVPISPQSQNNWQITPSRRRHEISHKLDSEDTMKASDNETVIKLPQ
jgi:hypothetical protein